MGIAAISKRPGRAILAAFFIAVISLVSVLPAKPAFAAVPNYVQSAANGTAASSSTSQAFSSANTAGNLIVVYLLWNNSGNATVTDSKGNAYVAATPRVSWYGGQGSSQVFYASNIAGGANTVTTTFSTKINGWGLMYIHEYSGIAASNPVDVTASATGGTAAVDSGSATTTHANDLIFGGVGSSGSLSAGGTGFTVRRTDFGNGTEDKRVTTTGSYNATATQSSGAWVMQMVAFKAADGDTTAPSTPTGLAVTSTSQTQSQLSWTAATDNVGVAGYNVYRSTTSGFTPSAANKVGTTTGTSYGDSGLSANTTYYYAVTAVDGSGNESAASGQAGLSVSDVTAPSVPANLTATATSDTTTTLSWTASTDNVGVTAYNVYRDGSLVATTTNTSYQDAGLSASTAYGYSVTAIDAAGNVSTASGTAHVTTLAAPDTTAPSVPAGLTATATNSTTVNVSWSAATDDTAVTGYNVYRDGSFVTTTTATNYQDTGRMPQTTYGYTVAAIDAAGNASAQSSGVSVTTPSAPDTTAPSVPSGLSATATSPSTVSLSWTASTDNVGVTAYKVYRNGSLVTTVTGTSYQDSGLAAGTTYGYSVAAIDAAGNTSATSATVNATTPVYQGSGLSGKLVSIGDSYTSGLGAGPYTAASGGCYISQNNAYVNYAASQLSALGGTITFENHGCAGAKSTDTVGGGLGILSGAKWVAMTIGANDYDFVTAIGEGSYGLQYITSHKTDITNHVANVVNVGKQSAPNAQYYILGYPDIMPPTGTNLSACFGSAASSIDLASAHQMYVVIDQALQDAAAQTGATFVETTSHFVGHDMCAGSASWFVPYGQSDTWHPIAVGQQELGTLLTQAIQANN